MSTLTFFSFWIFLMNQSWIIIDKSRDNRWNVREWPWPWARSCAFIKIFVITAADIAFIFGLKNFKSFVLTGRRQRTALSVSCPCLILIRSFRDGPVSVCYPDLLPGFCKSGFYLSRFCLLSGFWLDSLKKVVCMSGRTRTRQSRPDFRCPCRQTSVNWSIKTFQYCVSLEGDSCSEVVPKPFGSV